MATQRQSDSSPIVNNRSTVVSSPISPQPSRKNSLSTVIEEIPTIERNRILLHPNDEAQKKELGREAARRAVFDKASNKTYGVRGGYRKVEVLIIRWDEAIDDFRQGHDDEIRKLQTIFTIGYNYGCTVVSLLKQQIPQVALNLAVLKHIDKHNDDDTLLIVYYTGHGNRLVNEDGSRHLELAPSENAIDEHAALWHIAEDPLRSHATCDVLAILDCCYASTAAFKGHVQDFRTFQLLAASSEMNRTNGPGKHSFTNALCESLEYLGKDLKGGPFSVLKLFERINRLRPSQPALLWDRLNKSNDRSISLGRLEHVPTLKRPALVHVESPEKASLLLRISLKESDLADQEIDKFARCLPAACERANLPVHKIQWLEMKRRNPERMLRTAVDAFQRVRTRSSPDQVPKVNPLTVRNKRTASTASSFSSSAYHGGRRANRSIRGSQRRVSIQDSDTTIRTQDGEKKAPSLYLVAVLLIVSPFFLVSFTIDEKVLTILLLAVAFSYMPRNNINRRFDGPEEEEVEGPSSVQEESATLFRPYTWPSS